MTATELITDQELDRVWGSANFGTCSRRSVLKDALVSCLGGFSTGHTAKCIVVELGLVFSNKWKLTKLGEKYLFAVITEPPYNILTTND